MKYPREFRAGRAPVSAGQLNDLVEAVRDLQRQVGDVGPGPGIFPGHRRRFLGKILSYVPTGIPGLPFNPPFTWRYSWDEWELRDGVLQVRTGGVRGRVLGLDGWTNPDEYLLFEFQQSYRPGTVPANGTPFPVPSGTFVLVDEFEPSGFYLGEPVYVLRRPGFLMDFTAGTASATYGSGLSDVGGSPVTVTGSQFRGQVTTAAATNGGNQFTNSEFLRITVSPSFLIEINAAAISPADQATAALWGTDQQPRIRPLTAGSTALRQKQIVIYSGGTAFPKQAVSLYFSILNV